MDILRDGSFTFPIDTNDLAKGLRNNKRNPRNSKFLVECAGAVGLYGVLQVLDDVTDFVIDTAVITDDFPYPQVFVLTNMIIVCGETKIYEYISPTLTLKITASLAGDLWSIVDFFNYAYMSNGKVAIVRSAEDGTYSEVTDKPVANSICDFNGQVLIGAV